MSPRIEILLATFNEDRYLPEFLSSLENQTHKDWRLLVRDDGSHDGTGTIINTFQSKCPTQVFVLPDSGIKNLGVAGNYSRLLACSQAQYAMFANPDDIWLPRKIETTLQSMLEAERKYGSNHPILVHTDLTVVDSKLAIISNSLWNYQGLFPFRAMTLKRFCIENSAGGCTIMINRALLDLSGSIPDGTHHEDWWVAMVASRFGIIRPIPLSTILCRRHDRNDTVVPSIMARIMFTLGSISFAQHRIHNIITENQPRVQAFMDRFHDRLKPSEIHALNTFLRLYSINPIARRLAILRHGFRFTSWARTIGLLLFCGQPKLRDSHRGHPTNK